VHLSHLRSGRRDNPSARLLAGIAELFGVPIGHFFDSTLEDRINAEPEALTALRNERTKSLMLRARGVSPESMEHLDAILDRLRLIEGLDHDSDKTGPAAHQGQPG
jgi:transcriptional regulator with XRE-family HTH domain